jgi:phospholipase/carboxylesterase
MNVSVRVVRPAFLVSIILAAACATEPIPIGRPGRLTARPGPRVSTAPAPGEARLGLGGDKRDGTVYVPTPLRDDNKYPVLLLLHGAGGAGERIERRLQSLADDFGFIIVAPDSRGPTWDATRGGLGADVEFIDRVMRDVLARYPIDQSRIAIGGFSDGASYALTLGVINGDLFTHIIAFSPGYIATDYANGHPEIFVAHGMGDEILDIERTSRILVPGLRRSGFRVVYREFDGAHTISPEIAREAMLWWLSGAAPRGGAG